MVAKRRNQAIEALRIASAFAIVWCHALLPGSHVLAAGLSVFLMITMMFETGQNWSRKVSFGARFWRLIPPWVVAFALFAVLSLIKSKPVVDMSHGLLAGILSGSEVHLWYIPFILAALLVLDNLKGRVSRQSLFYGCLGLNLVLAIAIPYWRPWSLEAGYPVAQYFQAATPLFLGIMLGTYDAAKFGRTCLAITVLVLAAAAFYGFEDVAWPHVNALILLLLAMRFGNRLPQSLNLNWLSAAMFGVYLVHPLFFRIIYRFTGSFSAAGAVATFVLSTLAVLAYRLIKARLLAMFTVPIQVVPPVPEPQ